MSASTLLVAALAFASTNVDDLVVLLLLFGLGRRPRTVLFGQYLGFGAIVLASLVVSGSALLLPKEWIGFLGLLPFAIGAKGLAALRHRSDSEPEHVATAMGVLAIAAVTFANGGDNVAVYAPLFARRPLLDLVAMLLVFAVLVAVWCAAAQRLARLPGIATGLDRVGHWIAPLVLLGLGVYIFVANGAASYLLSRM